jgi:DNA-binding LytR/AlgR family response regulator
MFKVLLVNLLPLIILTLLYRDKWLKQAVDLLQEQNKEYRTKIEAYENGPDEEEIDIISENKSDRLKLKYSNIIFIKSADNYIEINYLNKDLVVKKMLRSTLRNIELQLSDKRNFLRCHRTHIVNTSFIEKLVKNYGVNSLKLNCCGDIIPVSRQYLIPIRVAINSFE